MGGGGTRNKVTLYTIKTQYKILGIKIFSKITTQIYQNSFLAYLELGRYITETCDIERKIKELIKGLDKWNQTFILRQIALSRTAYEDKNSQSIMNLTTKEKNELYKIDTEFYPNIFKINDNLYFYNGYFLPIGYFEESVFWHKHSLNILEPQTLTKMRQKDFIDVGGFVGDSAIIFEKEFCDKNIYTFEPTKENFRLLKRTLELNDSKRIIPINKGLGAETLSMNISFADGASSIEFKRNNNIEVVQVITLDEFVREHKIEVGFIKVDIEGFEMEFLKGAKETIATQKPAMLISIYHQPSDYFDIKPLIESWNLGYKFKIYKGIDYSLMYETALFCEIVE